MQVVSTDFYTIVPLSNNRFVFIIDGKVSEEYIFESIDQAEEFIITNYTSLIEEIRT